MAKGERIRVLITDGLDEMAVAQLRQRGYEVIEGLPEGVSLSAFLSRAPVHCLVVRSATRVTPTVIDAGLPTLRLIVRAGIGLDNIAVQYAESRGVRVLNTPGASVRSVAELALAHMLVLARNLHRSNRAMPARGATHFAQLKKEYARTSVELAGKTLLIVGLGRIGKEVARLAFLLGMKVRAYDPHVPVATFVFTFPEADNAQFTWTLRTEPLEAVLPEADFISVHTPALKRPVFTEAHFEQMKEGVCIINCARGGVVPESLLKRYVRLGKVRAFGLDVYEGEPTPDEELLRMDEGSFSPHVGASTRDAQWRVGMEVVDRIVRFFGGEGV